MEENSAFVIDSSFVLAYLLPDENNLQVQQFFDRLKVKKIRLITSLLLTFEVFNGFRTAVMRKRIKTNLASELGKKFLQIPLEYSEIDFNKALTIADKYNLTFYDATYLYLARSEKLPLLSLDEKLTDLA